MTTCYLGAGAGPSAPPMVALGWASESGTVNQNREPPPGLLATPTSPPSRRAYSRTRASPSPVPLRLPCSTVEPRQKGSKT